MIFGYRGRRCCKTCFGSEASTVVRREEMAPPAQRLFQPTIGWRPTADLEGDMVEARAEIRALIEAGLMSEAEASRIIARLEDAR